MNHSCNPRRPTQNDSDFSDEGNKISLSGELMYDIFWDSNELGFKKEQPGNALRSTPTWALTSHYVRPVFQ